MDASLPQPYWGGIDVAAEKFDAAVCPLGYPLKDWMRLKTRTFPLTRAGVRSFTTWLARQEGSPEGLCAEATGIYSTKLQELLEEKKDPPLPRLSITNPARIKGTARMLAAPGKTDMIDARVIAVFAAANRPAPKPPLREAHRDLREALKMRDFFQKQERAAENRLLSLRDPLARRMTRKAIRCLHAQFLEASCHVRNIIARDERFSRDAELLQSIPTVGPEVSASILSLYGDLRQYSRREVVAIAGLAPVPHESGKSVHGRARISKRGGGSLRGKMYLGTTRLLHHDYGFNTHVMKRFHNGAQGKVCICAAMRKVLVLARAVIRSGKPYDPARARA